MKIYIVERDNPSCKPEPKVYINGMKALDKVKEEYQNQMEELNTSQERQIMDMVITDAIGILIMIVIVVIAFIDSDSDDDRWEWRITEHEIKV